MYQDRLQIDQHFFYPTFSINISAQIFQLIDDSFSSKNMQDATRTVNALYRSYYLDNLQNSEEAVIKLKNIVWEQFL